MLMPVRGTGASVPDRREAPPFGAEGPSPYRLRAHAATRAGAVLYQTGRPHSKGNAEGSAKQFGYSHTDSEWLARRAPHGGGGRIFQVKEAAPPMRRYGFSNAVSVCIWEYSRTPSSPALRPMPDCFTPP